jgi:hypothetical protein
VPIYLIIQAGSKDGSSSTVALYINSCIVCGFFPSWQGAPPQSFEQSIWDRVGFYMIHTFLEPSVESQFRIISKSYNFLFGIFIRLLLPSLIVTSSQVRVGTPLPLLSCYISGLGPEGLLQSEPSSVGISIVHGG